jgi:hypothetical protein
MTKEKNKEYYLVSIKEQGVKDFRMIGFEVEKKETPIETLEQIYDYCERADMTIMYLGQITERYFNNTQHRCRISFIDSSINKEW